MRAKQLHASLCESCLTFRWKTQQFLNISHQLKSKMFTYKSESTYIYFNLANYEAVYVLFAVPLVCACFQI